jgi:hypothetical protein
MLLNFLRDMLEVLALSDVTCRLDYTAPRKFKRIVRLAGLIGKKP